MAGRRSRTRNTNAMFDIVRAEPGGRASAARRLDPARPRRAAVRRVGLELRSDEGGRQAQGLQAGPAQGRRSTSTATPRPRSSPRTMSSACCPARARPDETVIYTAHWDHLGIGQPDANGDRIYNGAIDNGTGIAHLIEQARAFAARPAHRSGRSCSWPSPPRKRACSAANIMPPTRSIRRARPPA